MAANAYRESASDNSPLDFRLDMLVDGELPEEQRRELLLTIDRQGDTHGSWRSVALRFLQRQTEQQAVRQLMDGGTVVPVEFVPELTARRSVLGRIRPWPVMAAAAGLLIAIASATITFYAVRTPGRVSGTPAVAEFRAMIPREVISSDEALPVSVPMVRNFDNAMVFPVSNESDTEETRKSVIIQSDGRNGFIMIPVSTSKTKVY